jgi:hypothetical protein
MRPLHTALLASAVVGVAMIPIVRRLRHRHPEIGHDGGRPDAAPKPLRSSTSDRREAAPKVAGTTTPLAH